MTSMHKHELTQAGSSLHKRYWCTALISILSKMCMRLLSSGDCLRRKHGRGLCRACAPSRMSQHPPSALRWQTSARLYTRSRDSRCPSLARMSSCRTSCVSFKGQGQFKGHDQAEGGCQGVKDIMLRVASRTVPHMVCLRLLLCSTTWR